MGLLSYLFGEAHDNLPLEERELLRVGPRGWFDRELPVRHESSATNMNTYLDDGRLERGVLFYGNDQYIDWNSDDTFTRAMTTIRQNTYARIEASDVLQGLLNKESWSREDRVIWEREVAEIVNDEHKAIPGLRAYRNTSDRELYPETQERVVRLNDLSADMENGTRRLEHDCETHAKLEGIILQQVDNHFLPDMAPDEDYKQRSGYFYVVGRVNFSPTQTGSGSHAYLVSSATTNVLEGTNTLAGYTYKENTNPNMSFKDFIDGGIIINTDGTMYTGYHYSREDLLQVRLEDVDLSYDTMFAQTPSISDLSAQRYEDAPPSAQALMDIKQHVEKLEETRNDGCDIWALDIKIAQYKALFADTIKQQAEDGSIFESIDFMQNVILHEGTYEADGVLLDRARVQIAEMNPDWTEDQVDRRLFDIRIGNIEEIQNGPYKDYEAFRIAKAREIFEREHPDFDYDEARAAYNTGVINNQISAMRRGEIPREDVLADRDSAMALAYTEAHSKIYEEYPKPGTAGAYAQMRDRLQEVFEEYDRRQNLQACENIFRDPNVFDMAVKTTQ